MIPHDAKLPHLRGAMRHFHGLNGLGTCFQDAVALVMDVPTARLVIGTFPAQTDDHPAGARERLLHAWVEVGGKVYAPSLIPRLGRLQAIPRDEYYASNDAQDVLAFDRAAVMRFARKGGLRDYYLRGRRHRFPATFGETLLTTLGVPFRADESGGVLPA